MVVDELLGEIGVGETPVVHVFNKIDLLAPEVVEAMRARMANLLPDALFVSARREPELEPLRELLRSKLASLHPVTDVRVPAGNGKLLAEIHREAEVISSRLDEETGEMVLAVRADAASRSKWGV